MVFSAVYGFVMMFVIFGVGLPYTEGDKFPMCANVLSNITLNQVIGPWNVLEVIEHANNSDPPEFLGKTEADPKSCPQVNFTRLADREIRMLWCEPAGNLQFDFMVTNLNIAGMWMSNGIQTGTLLNKAYGTFSGTAQLTKFNDTQMLVTFCSPDEKHFTVVLARTRHLNSTEVVNQLARYGLPLVKINNYCGSVGCPTVGVGDPVTVLMALLAAAAATTSTRLWLFG